MNQLSANRTESDSPAGHAVWYWCIFLAILFVVIGIRIRLLGLPLERDEGEFALMGQMMLKGIPPYQEAYNLKFPGIYGAYAIILAVFGQSPVGVHLGLLVVSLLTTAFLFLLVRKLFDSSAAAVAAASFSVLSIHPPLLGFSAHATHFVILFAVAGLYFLLCALERRSRPLLVGSGVLFGFAMLMKQPGIFFLCAGVTVLVMYSRKETKELNRLIKQIGIFLAGFCLPLAVSAVWLALAGVFQRFWFWTVTYAVTYGKENSLSTGIHDFFVRTPMIIGAAIFLWLLAALGMTSLWWNVRARPHRAFSIVFLLASFAALSMGLYFRRHYYVLLLPFLATMIGIATASIAEQLTSKLLSGKLVHSIVPAIFLLACLYSFYEQRSVFFTLSTTDACRMMFGDNPFPESMDIGTKLHDMTSPGDRIAVVVSEPQLYFYSHRLPATGYLYTYSLMEQQPYALQMQEEMIRQIESAMPRCIVYVSNSYSWQASPESNHHIFEWFNEFIRRGSYEIAGVVDISLSEPSTQLWGDASQGYNFTSPNYIVVFRRRM